jgi:lipopolysaccharide export system protein LptA
MQIRPARRSGGVVVRSPSETARGDFGIYDLDRKLITLIGASSSAAADSQVSGARLVIDLDSGRAVIDGGPAGVGQSGGRVTGRFTVPQRAALSAMNEASAIRPRGRGAAAAVRGLEVRSIAKATTSARCCTTSR